MTRAAKTCRKDKGNEAFAPLISTSLPITADCAGNIREIISRARQGVVRHVDLAISQLPPLLPGLPKRRGNSIRTAYQIEQLFATKLLPYMPTREELRFEIERARMRTAFHGSKSGAKAIGRK